MITPEERKNLIELVKRNINLILAKTPEELIREEDLGRVLSFKPAEETFKNIFEVAKKLQKVDLEKIPHNRLESFNSEIGEFGELIGRIIEFKPNQTGGYSRENIIDRAENIHNSIFTNIVPYINYLDNEISTLEIQKKESQEIINSIKFMQNEVFEKKTNTIKEADELLKTLKETASESGVTKYSEIFAIEAKENKIKANHWLIATVILGLFSIVIAYFFLTIRPASNEPSYYEIIHFALTKIIVFSILYYLLVLFVKNYNAQRHNYVVNKHRQNALTTFGTFVSSTKDIDTKNAVLLQTTHSIFSAQTSGYLKNDVEPEPSQKLIEIIRASNSINNK